MDRLTRHDLKTDKFVEEVAHSVEFIEGHRNQLYRYGGIALAVVAVAAGVWWYMQKSKAERQVALYEAIQTYNATVSATPAPEGQKTFPTEAARTAAIQKDLGAIIASYSGSSEAAAASYLLGANAADQGKMPEAERYLKQAVESGSAEYSSLAKMSLAEIYASQGKTADAEKLLRELVSNPTAMVSKEQASISLARVIAKTKPDEARKLLEPLRTVTGSASRQAIQTLSDLGLSR